MKKILLALLASTAVGGVASAQDFPDVPAGSYAEEAVARLADLGIVIGFPDGTFRGDEAFTRYQAALIVTRLLDVVEGEMLTDADLDTVRNALQELASDVAANEQAVSDLQAAIDGADGADAVAVEELQAQLDAALVELDTLSAAQGAAAALEQQVASNTDQIGQLNDLVGILNEDLQGVSAGGDLDTSFLETIEQNTSDIANLREFVVLLRRDQVGLTERVATVEESDTAQNARLDDIDTRVTALEESQVAFGGSIGLNYDVSRLSGDEVPFDVDRIFGVGLSRAQPVSVFNGTFNEDATDDLNDDDDEEDAGEEAQDRQDIEFSKGDLSPELTLNVDFSAERGLAPESGLNTFESSVALELVEATILDPDADVDGDPVDGPFDFTDPDNYFEGYVFRFSDVEATFGPIGADPLNFYFGPEPGAEFSDYVFESLGSGFRADVGTPDFLAFLQPTLQIAYGVYEQGGDEDDDTIELPDPGDAALASGPDLPGATALPNVFADAYYRGIRGTLTPFSFSGGAAAEAVDEAADEAVDAAAAATTDDNVEEGLVEDTLEEAGAAAEGAGAAVDAAADAGAGFLASTGGFSATGGFSCGQLSGNARENADAAEDNADITVCGLDGQVNLSIFNVTFEYAQNSIEDGIYFQDSDNVLQDGDDEAVSLDGLPVEEEDEVFVGLEVPSTSLVYAEATIDTEAAGIPLLRSLSANYRSIPELWFGLKYDEDTYPYELDQVGYGADATLGLSIFNLTGFVDSYSLDTGEAGASATDTVITTDGTSLDATDIFAYGVRLGVEVYRAVEVFGFYTVVEANGGTAVEDLDDADRSGADDAYVPGIGIGVEHDGEAENALVPGLNFSAAYDFTNGNFSAADFDAEFAAGAFTLSPYVSYSIDDSEEVGSDDVTAIRAGTGITTEPLNIILQPSFGANVNYRTAEHIDVSDADAPGAGGAYTANYIQYSFGVTFNQFLFENSAVGVRYGSFNGTNIQLANNSNGADDNASDISDGDDYSADSVQTTTGYEVTWDYYGLQFGYGAYTNTRPGATPGEVSETGGQAFSISYTVNF